MFESSLNSIFIITTTITKTHFHEKLIADSDSGLNGTVENIMVFSL